MVLALLIDYHQLIESIHGAHYAQSPCHRPRRAGFVGTIWQHLGFTICFAVWMMFAVLGIPIKTSLGLNETQFGLLAATPVLTGSLVRVPLGIWTDRYGGRIVFFLLMLSTVIPIYLISYATE